MKALDILKEIRNSENDCDHLKAHKFDEAIKELEDLQNRTCINCKYATLDNARYLPVHKCLVGCNGVDYNFYCNKWKQK